MCDVEIVFEIVTFCASNNSINTHLEVVSFIVMTKKFEGSYLVLMEEKVMIK